MGDVNELRVDREIKEMRLVDEAVQKELTKRRDMQRERDKKRMEVQKLRKMLGMLESFVELRERRQFNDRVDQLWLRELQTQMNTIQMKINETQSEIDEELRSAARQKRELYYHSPVDYATFAKRRRDWDRYICGSRSTLGDEDVAVEDMVLNDQLIPPSNEVWSRYLVKF